MQLSAVVVPENASDKELTWISMNDAIATVDNGMVTAVSAGMTTIIASTKEGLSATYSVTVQDSVVEVTGIKLNKTTDTAIEGTVLVLSATVTPNNADEKKVLWSTDNEAVAKVSKNGTVTCVSPGKAMITAKTANGTAANCAITVIADAGNVREIYLNKVAATILEGDSICLTASIVPKNAENGMLHWESSDETVVTVNDGIVTGISEGTAVITVMAGEKQETCEITVKKPSPSAESDGSINPELLFKVPYISNYYFETRPSINDEIAIPLYLTDYEQSEYINNDETVKLDLLYQVDDNPEQVIKDVPAGDYTLLLGRLSKGMHTFYVQARDGRTNLKSHRLFKEVWVIDPDEEAAKMANMYEMTATDLENYGIHCDNSMNATDLINTRDGLTRLFADVQAKGYCGIKLLKGIYRINGENARSTCIAIPSYFTVDMNGSTFKLDTIKSDINNSDTDPSVEGCIVRMEDAVDAHLINGTLEGDRFERQGLGLEKGAFGEGINTVRINGGKYCSLENMTIKATTGHSITTLYKNKQKDADITLKDFSPIALINGKEIAKSDCSTTPFIDLQTCLDADPDEDYVYVGHWMGYRGIQGKSPIVYYSFYDADKNFMEMVAGYQFRKMKITNGARYVRITLLGTNFPTGKYDANSVSLFTSHYGEYHEIKNTTFVDTRTCALATAVCNNLLIEGCKYDNCGHSITSAAVDFEDGAQQCQDIFYLRNDVLHEAGTATVIDNYGFNHVYEECTNHSIEIRNQVLGGVVRNINDVDSHIIEWDIGDKMYGEYGRIYNNYLGRIKFKEKTNREVEHVDFVKVKNCTFGANSLESLVDKVIFENCKFPAFFGGNGTFVHCQIQPLYNIGGNLYFYDCTFKRLDGKLDTINYDFGSQANTERLFKNCRFEGKIEPNRMLRCATFLGCEFEDITLFASVANPAVWEVDYDKCGVYYEDCKIGSSAKTFLTVGPYSNDSGYVKYIFKNCIIEHTGDKMIGIEAKPSADSEIVFDGCSINKEIDTSLNPDLIKVID